MRITLSAVMEQWGLSRAKVYRAVQLGKLDNFARVLGAAFNE